MATQYGRRNQGASNSNAARSNSGGGSAPEFLTFVKVGVDHLPQNEASIALKEKFPNQKMLGVGAVKQWKDSGNTIIELDANLLPAADQYGKIVVSVFDMAYTGQKK